MEKEEIFQINICLGLTKEKEYISYSVVSAILNHPILIDLLENYGLCKEYYHELWYLKHEKDNNPTYEDLSYDVLQGDDIEKIKENPYPLMDGIRHVLFKEAIQNKDITIMDLYILMNNPSPIDKSIIKENIDDLMPLFLNTLFEQQRTINYLKNELNKKVDKPKTLDTLFD